MGTLITHPEPARSTPPPQKDRRRYRRYAVNNTQLWISWVNPRSQAKMIQGRVLNICEGGMGLELPEAPAVSSKIRFHSEKLKLVGTAKVCHTRQMGQKFYVGAEFVDGKRWIPPGEPIQEPISLAVFYLPILLSAATVVNS